MAAPWRAAAAAEKAEVERLLKAVPERELAGAFGGDSEALQDCALRALRGAERGFDSALAEVRATLAWRRAHNVDEVRARRSEGVIFPCDFRGAKRSPPHRLRAQLRETGCALAAPTGCADAAARAQLLSREAPGCADFRAAWPSTLCGPDAAGNVVWLDRLAQIDVHALAALPPAGLVAGRAQQLEAVQARKRRAPAAVRQSQHFYVLDCADGMLPLTPSTWRVLRELTALGAEHYASTLRRCFVINAHPAARLAWAALRVILHPDTVARVRIVADAAELRRLAAAEGVIVAQALPASLGGACADAAPLARDIADAQRAAAQRAARAAEADAPPTPRAAPEPLAAPAPAKSPRRSKHMKRQRSNTSSASVRQGGADRRMVAPREPPRKG